jgi:hypothetical protein
MAVCSLVVVATTRIGKFIMPGCQPASCGPVDGIFSNGFE